MLLTFSGSHGPPWEPIPCQPRQDRYAFPRWSGGNEEKTTNPHPALSQVPAWEIQPGSSSFPRPNTTSNQLRLARSIFLDRREARAC